MDIFLRGENRLQCGEAMYRCTIGKGGLVAAEARREGDMKTPLGLWPLRACYFRPDRVAAPVTGLPLVALRPDMGWCDDPAHARYNQLVRVPAPVYAPTPTLPRKRGREPVRVPPPAGEGAPFFPPPAGGDAPFLPPPAGGGRSGGGKFGAGRYSTRNANAMQNAKALRRNLTDAERLLWSKLRGRQLAGCRFRRQYAIGPYIADFVCLEKRLVVELDSGQHAERIAYDARRASFLTEAGFDVLRFWNNELFENPEGVMERIVAHVLSPTPTLPRKRGREPARVPPAAGGDAPFLPPPAGGGRSGGGQAAMPFSYENLWREDNCYDLIIPMGYNDDPIVAGRGSAIFMHVAKPDYEGTEGCIALSREDMLAVLAQLTPASRLSVQAPAGA